MTRPDPLPTSGPAGDYFANLVQSAGFGPRPGESVNQPLRPRPRYRFEPDRATASDIVEKTDALREPEEGALAIRQDGRFWPAENVLPPSPAPPPAPRHAPSPPRAAPPAVVDSPIAQPFSSEMVQIPQITRAETAFAVEANSTPRPGRPPMSLHAEGHGRRVRPEALPGARQDPQARRTSIEAPVVSPRSVPPVPAHLAPPQPAAQASYSAAVQKIPEPAPSPRISISIGRIEIKAAAAQAPLPAPRERPRPLGLDEYLKARAGGG